MNREEAARPKASEPGEDFSQDLAGAAARAGGHVDDSQPAGADKDLRQQLAGLDSDELARLSVLTIGTRLEQGGIYVDLHDLTGGPFKAIGSQEAGPDSSYVAKRDTDHELWNRLVGQGKRGPGGATVVRRGLTDRARRTPAALRSISPLAYTSGLC